MRCSCQETRNRKRSLMRDSKRLKLVTFRVGGSSHHQNRSINEPVFSQLDFPGMKIKKLIRHRNNADNSWDFALPIELIPIIMRALIREGEPKTLRLDVDHAEPSAADFPSSYIVRTKTTALTRGELAWPEPLTQTIPVPGYDLAGIIISTPTLPPPDNGEHRFRPGDEIYALTAFTKQGNAREASVAQENEMALKPSNMSWEDAATVPLSALSAWQALFVHGKLSPDFDKARNGGHPKPRVLITAASGGVGVWGAQLAHLAGADVVGTCGPSNVDLVRGLGADRVLDYTQINIWDWVSADRKDRGFDVVLDCIGGKTLTDAWKCARKGGRVVSVAEPPDSQKPIEGIAEQVEGVWFIVSGSGEQLAHITDLIENDKCRAVVDRVYSLENWDDAFSRLEGGHAKGKVVLRVG